MFEFSYVNLRGTAAGAAFAVCVAIPGGLLLLHPAGALAKGTDRGDHGAAAGDHSGPAGNAASKANSAASLGSLNGAHAAARAFDVANGNSVVGKLAAYMDAMAAYQAALLSGDTAAQDAALADAAAALAGAANKGYAIDPALVHEVNMLLDGKQADFEHDAIHNSEEAIASLAGPGLIAPTVP